MRVSNDYDISVESKKSVLLCRDDGFVVFWGRAIWWSCGVKAQIARPGSSNSTHQCTRKF